MPVTPEALARMAAAYAAYQATIDDLADEASDGTVTVLTTAAGRVALVKTADGQHQLLPIEAEVTATA